MDALVEANGLSGRSAVLAVGRTLTVPASAAPHRATHTVVKGDTLYSIARRNGTTVDALVVANGMASAEAVLAVGRSLIIP